MTEIVVEDFVNGARRARGVAIVIDVFRACSFAAHALALGAQRVVPVAEIETARHLKQRHPHWLLAGERFAKPLDGFDCGNSPTELEQHAVAGRTILHTTHAGTQGLVAAASACSMVFTGALVNLTATVKAALATRPSTITLCRMGHEAQQRCAEDDLCADLMSSCIRAITGRGGSQLVREVTRELVRTHLRTAPAAQKFFDPAASWAPQRDFDICTAVDEYDFALAWQRASDGLGVLQRSGPG